MRFQSSTLAQHMKKNPRAMRRAFKVLLPLSILSFLLSYYFSCLPCFLPSIKLYTASLIHGFNHFTSKKAMFLFFNASLLFLARGSGFTTSSASLDTFSDGYKERIEDGHHDHLSQSNFIKIEESVPKDPDSEEIFTVVQEEKKFASLSPVIADCNLIVAKLQSCIQVPQCRELRSCQLCNMKHVLKERPTLRSEPFEEKAVILEERAIMEFSRTLEVAGVEGEANEDSGVDQDQLELLGIEELNTKFEEFIEREKRKWRLEAPQLVMV